MSVGIYVVMHKPVDIPRIRSYKQLYVGAYNKEKTASVDCYDCTGDNISYKNKNYCELTGLYWMWKNADESIQGLCHYRRYFTMSRISSNPKRFLTEEKIIKTMQRYDVILPVRRYYKERVIDAIKTAPNMKDIEEMRRAIQCICPEYLEAYESFLIGNQCYLYNMIITKKPILDQYCEWLFKLLEFIEGEYQVDNEDPYRSRLFGFLSERLIYVWISKNIASNKIKEFRVIKTDETALWQVGQDIKNELRNWVFRIKEILSK